MRSKSLQHGDAREIVDDAVAFFEGTGIYHDPYSHDGRHYVAEEQYTTEGLEEEMCRILACACTQVRLQPREEQIASYYFGQRTGGRMPLMVGVTESVCGEPSFVCKYFDGTVVRPAFPSQCDTVPADKSQPDGKRCEVHGCRNVAGASVKVGLFSSMKMCSVHASGFAQKFAAFQA
jgi:hypothetical protein